MGAPRYRNHEGQEQIIWLQAHAWAETLSTEELWGNLLDILRSLDVADAMDRETGSNRGGLYRDEAFVVRRELQRRLGNSVYCDLRSMG